MKKLFKVLGRILVLLIVAAVFFFFWASSPTMDENEYQQLITNQFEDATDNDSIYSIVTYNIGYLSGMTNNRAVAKPKELFDT